MIKKYFLLGSILALGCVTYILLSNQSVLNITNKHHQNPSSPYRFNERNNLQAILTPSWHIEFTFDSEGLKQQKRINGELKERYLWLGEGQLHAVLNKEGDLLRQYFYDSPQAPLPAGVKIENRDYFFIFNPMRNLRLVLNSERQIVKILDYDDYGNIIQDSHPELKIDFGYAGGIWDEDAKLWFYTQGVYDPKEKEWITKVEGSDIISNLKDLSRLDSNDVYVCHATLDVYYHTYLCANRYCGGFYALDYLEYINGRGSMVDNSIYFSPQRCTLIKPSKDQDPAEFASCIHQKITSKEYQVFHAFTHNCHHEASEILDTCKNSSSLKATR
ncbi:hypothetical protein [Wolinella succinogenes]|uniref:RHS repeat domain-containing protein n=1 Tax=Wolinella succinogenes TaxID=844 RepID=UPI002FC7E847